MRKILPDKFVFIHNYCFFLHDLMVDIIKDGEKNNKFSVEVKLNPDEKELFTHLYGEELYGWMKTHNHIDEADTLTYKQIFVATLSDFLQFIYNSLKASEKGHLAVTYSLLRKPLKDNLFILENLISDPDEFLKLFESDTSYSDIAIDNQTKEEKKCIIKKVLDKIPFKYLDPEFLYNIRYSKEEHYSLEPIWQKATHIVTSCKSYRTEKGNLNFIFSDKDCKLDQWEQLYFLLPSIMFYTFQICYTLYYVTIAKTDKFKDYIWDRIIVGLIISCNISTKNTFNKLTKLKRKFSLRCKICESEIEYTNNIENDILKYWEFTCKNGHKNKVFEH